MKIRYSKFSKIDLKEIAEFITADSPKYAKIEIKAIENFISKLKRTPLIGRSFENSKNPLAKVVVFKSYLIIYTIEEDKYIDTLTIHHHSRSFSRNPAIGTDE